MNKYYEQNKDHIKAYIKQWRVDNKEKVHEYDKVFYEKHKEKIKAKRRMKNENK